MGWSDPKDLAAALCFALGMPFVDFDETAVQPTAAHTVPEELARRHAAIGVEIKGDTITVVFADPADHLAFERGVHRGQDGDRSQRHPRRR